ncbi:MAG: ADP-ribose pyrophosphatase [Thermoplasmata archaeon HGW-Thermoplasmata-1]|nr:MAG: ADP-ribose pyrophosphatase [Thermoplasmata archaeon HGW-Thermoplasmata-1]
MEQYRNPALTVDGVVLENEAFCGLRLLLIKRGREPFLGRWALPGGFVGYGELTEDAAVRELKEETGLDCRIIGLVGVYSDPKRDPRKHTVSVTYLMEKTGGTLTGGDDAAEAKFFDVNELPPLAFDHDKIIRDAFALVRDNRNVD